MKKVQAYKCDHCSKSSTSPGAMFQHERKCRSNPNNKHKCFDYCRHLKREYAATGQERLDFVCQKTGKLMYSYKAEYRGFKLDGLERMPLNCTFYEFMTIDEENERFEKQYMQDNE